MAGDIYGYKRNPKPSAVFSAENTMLTFGNVGNVGAKLGYLVQNWNVAYSQNVAEMFELGSNALYWSKSRPQGQGTLGRIIGAQDADSSDKGFFPKEAYDVCLGGALISLTAQGGSCDTQPANSTVKLGTQVKIDMDGCIVTSVGFSMSVGDMLLQEQLGWRFGYMALS